MNRDTDLLDILDHIDPTSLDYSQWVEVGMALKHEGYGFDIWDSWSSRDVSRYKGNGVMLRKWNDFGKSSASPVTGGTIVALAQACGWSPSRQGHALAWDDAIGAHDGLVDPSWVEGAEVSEPKRWNATRDLKRYLEALFEPDDYVGYVVSAWEKDDKWIPKDKGVYTRTAGNLLDAMSLNGKEKNSKEIASIIGDYTPEAGAWIRFNPLDGKGVNNSDVTEFRYTLVESDTLPIDKQNAIIKELQLPVAALVHSGNKSMHAIVHIDAADYDEYRKRVDELYSICAKNGLIVDTQNKNPSRLSRMPGVLRGDQRQFLVDTNIGKKSWSEWKAWYDESTDDLPEIEELDEDWDDIPSLPQPIIDGMLYPGDKMMLSGQSKAGKSFALMELCIAVAEGGKWLGRPCAKGRVLYVNLELKRDVRRRRFRDVYNALGCESKHRSEISCFDLKGHSAPLSKLSQSIIRRAAGKNYSLIVIDPIYKVLDGDENSAENVSTFCNQLDVLIETLGCAIVYCHHHSKGNQGQKASIDRASGSGVFARDADALIDMIELEVTEDRMNQLVNKAECDHMGKYLQAQGKEQQDIPQDALVVSAAFRRECMKILPTPTMNRLIEELDALDKTVRYTTAWRIEGTLREFPRFSPIPVWFRYPVHIVDDSGLLKDAETTEKDPWKKGAEKSKKKADTRQKDIVKLLYDAIAECTKDDVKATRENVRERIGELDEKAITMGQLKSWTQNRSASWNSVKCVKEDDAWVLKDTSASRFGGASW